jgi:hypothetical protein
MPCSPLTAVDFFERPVAQREREGHGGRGREGETSSLASIGLIAMEYTTTKRKVR